MIIYTQHNIFTVLAYSVPKRVDLSKLSSKALREIKKKLKSGDLWLINKK